MRGPATMGGGLVLLAWISVAALVAMAALYTLVSQWVAACLLFLACLCAVFALVFREPRANGRHHEQEQEEEEL